MRNMPQLCMNYPTLAEFIRSCIYKGEEHKIWDLLMSLESDLKEV